MKICFIVGDHLRHTYLYNSIASSFDISAAIVVVREPSIPNAPDLEPSLRKLHDMHFERRLGAETWHFGNATPLWKSSEHIKVDMASLNSVRCIEYMKQYQPDLLITWGVPILGNEMLAAIPGEKWNIHGGLSPWYRGTATHFWPSYMLEPQMTGMTVHRISPQVDGGEIVHQTVAPLVSGDGLHDLGCRAIIALCLEMSALLTTFQHCLKDGRRLVYANQKTSGKIWRTSDWQPNHLRLIYELFGDRIVDSYLEGRFVTRPPKIFRGNLITTE